MICVVKKEDESRQIIQTLEVLNSTLLLINKSLVAINQTLANGGLSLNYEEYVLGGTRKAESGSESERERGSESESESEPEQPKKRPRRGSRSEPAAKPVKQAAKQEVQTPRNPPKPIQLQEIEPKTPKTSHLNPLMQELTKAISLRKNRTF